MPSTMAWVISRAINHSVLVGSNESREARELGLLVKRVCSARPGGLGGEDRHGAGRASRQDLVELRALSLPLEDERVRACVLAERVELHRALHGGQRGAAVQVRDDLG